MAEEDGAVELSLRLRTGDDASRAAAAAAARRRRSMTIFYNGRVCAVDVTELQARTIISMASQGNCMNQQRQIGDDRHYHQADSSSSNSGSVSTAAAAPRCVAGGSSQIDPSPAAAPLEGREAAAPPAVVAPMMVNQAAAASGLSMKRSLQRFLEKRKTRAAAAGPFFAGDRPAARR
uniref:Protein TIFY n=1 Tax=Leersia perrieri TaxID=77586 RepID=A0A0D9WVK0_9ORYZ